MMVRTRTWLLCVVGAALVAGCRSAPPEAAEAAPPTRNVVFIMGDDHAAYALGAYGSDVARTPHLDALAAQGVRFDRAYANSPVCTPSRQSILTGRLPHAAGVTLLRTPLSTDQVTIADHLKARGFATAAVGKMHFNAGADWLRRQGFPDSVVARASDHHGFDVRYERGAWRAWREAEGIEPPDGEVRPPWRPFQDPARVWLNADVRPGAMRTADSDAAFYVDRAIDFMEAHRDDRFCLWLSFHEPHSPFNFPVELAGTFDPAAMPVPAVSPEDDRWTPAIFRDMSDADTRGIAAAYYTSVYHLDQQVGRVLNHLDRSGLADETLVVYVGDHGYLLGHHGRFEKHMMWEEAVRAPLLIRAPGIAPGATDAFVEFIDLVPTINDALGVEPMPTADGRSLWPLVQGQTDAHRDAVFSEFLEDEKAMVRTDRWKYIFTTGANDLGQGYATGLGAPGLTHRLYDVQDDPAETTNLAGDPAHAEALRRMQARMLDRFRASHPDAEALPEGLSIDEQLAWFVRPRDFRPDDVR